ncbi:hypothetical protein Hanom_Chr14g01263531 [Helianthus anomalus]
MYICEATEENSAIYHSWKFKSDFKVRAQIIKIPPQIMHIQSLNLQISKTHNFFH